ncbi:preprotein translocase subunit SecG [Francisellaceae bacterium]|nr:preprotein translocase subunit SecG [Francisellaceae bacterium]
MLNLVLAAHIFIAIVVTVLVLVQHGKGADMGASFGSGSSQTVFGSKGAAPFLMKLTGFLAALFFVSSLTMGYLSKQYVDASNTLAAPIPTKIQPKKPDLNIPNNSVAKTAPLMKTDDVSKVNNTSAVPSIPEK